ncbi:MAG: hypothetical protein ACK4NY_17750 [Spirosomataceae bacterium]
MEQQLNNISNYSMMKTERILTPDLLNDILSEFTWGVPFSIVDDFPDPIIVNFPRCTLFFSEDTYDNHEINLRFDYSQTETEYNLTLFDALHYVFIPEAKRNINFTEPILYMYVEGDKVENVKVSVRNICILLKTYLTDCINGDFSWVDRYKLAVQ